MTLEIRKTMTTSPAIVGTNQTSRDRIISRRRIELFLFRTASLRLLMLMSEPEARGPGRP